MNLRFPSLLKPDELGYEFNDDSMTFWNEAYRHGTILHMSAGVFNTLGDGFTQHTPLGPCQLYHFTDYCLSLTSHLLTTPDAELPRYRIFREEVNPDGLRFLANLYYNDEKPKWFCYAERKVSTSSSKEHDKRWHRLPDYANGSMGAVWKLWHLGMGENHIIRSYLELYHLHEQFNNTLRAVAPYGDWEERVVQWHAQLEGDHYQAYRALLAAVEAREKNAWAQRSLNNALATSKPKPELQLA